MRESRLQVFKGMATKATRNYMGGVFAKLKPEGYRLIVPCVGRFTLPQVARAAGWDSEWIETSDVSLFSSVVGYHAAGRDIAELGIRYSEDLAWLLGHIDDGHAAGAALFAMKLAQLRRSETYYSRTFRDELMRDRGGYVHQFQERADELRAALGPIRYRTADLFEELERSRDADDALVYINPPGYGGGYTRMFDFGETVAWDAPEIAEFNPKEGVRRITEWALEAKCLVFWYRIREVTDDERPYVVFGHEQNPGVVDYILCNRPEAVPHDAVPRKVTATLPDKAPIIPHDHEITPDSVIGCRAVPKQVALYYRDLCAHKLGVTRAERYFVLTVDGYIFGVTGIFVSDLNRRRLIDGGYPIHETLRLHRAVPVPAHGAAADDVPDHRPVSRPDQGDHERRRVRRSDHVPHHLPERRPRTQDQSGYPQDRQPRAIGERQVENQAHRPVPAGGVSGGVGEMARQTRREAGLESAERLCAAGDNLEVWQVHYTHVREQDLNARVMPPEMLERLTENIRNERRMESLPLGVLRDGYIELISGHHRVRAAVAAEVFEFPMLVDLRDLPASAVKAKQLAHNAIAGADDMDMLAQIFSQIDTIEHRLEAFVTLGEDVQRSLAEAAKIMSEEVVIRWPVLAITFLPLQMQRLEAVAERLAQQVPKDAGVVWAVPEEIAQRFSEVLNRLGKAQDIRTVGNIIGRMAEMVEAELDRAEASDEE